MKSNNNLAMDNMFAVIRTGGKQYKVSKDDVLHIEKLEADQGSTVDFDDVLFGEGGKKAKVTATVLEHMRAAKVIIFKKKRRQNYRRRKGHRQYQTVVKITDVKAA